MTSYRGTIGFASDDPRSPVLPGDYTFAAADRGVHTFRGRAAHGRVRGDRRSGTRPTGLARGAASRVLVGAGPVAALAVSAPSRAVAGVPFDVRVSAVDAWRNWVPAYRGTVAFRSTDGKVRSLPSRYTFTAADRGSTSSRVLTTLVSTGRFLVVAADAARPTVTGNAPTLVAGAGAALQGQVLSGFDPLGGATVTVYDAVTGKRLGTVALGPTPRSTGSGACPRAGSRSARRIRSGPRLRQRRAHPRRRDRLRAPAGHPLVQSLEEATFGPYLDLV